MFALSVPFTKDPEKPLSQAYTRDSTGVTVYRRRDFGDLTRASNANFLKIIYGDITMKALC